MKSDEEIIGGLLDEAEKSNDLWGLGCDELLEKYLGMAVEKAREEYVSKEEITKSNLLKINILQSAIDKLIREDMPEDFKNEFKKLLEEK